MRIWHVLRSRLQSLLFRTRREADLREELQFHLDREAERLEAGGMPPDAARLEALRAFGAVEPTKEACRDARGITLLDNAARDIRYAVRSFRRAPLAALTIVITVGLGLGLVAAVFTVLNAYVFRADAVRNPYEIFAVERQPSFGAAPEGFTRSQYETLVRETDVFRAAFATTRDVEGRIEGMRREGALVTGNFFEVLGVSAARGRTLSPADDQPGSPPVIVLSHRSWSQHFGSDPGVVGRTLRVNGAPFDVVGVMPDGFRGLLPVAAPDFWAPLSVLQQFRPVPGREGSVDLAIVGRLRPGLSRDQALARLLVWDSRRAAEQSGARPAASLVLEPRPGTAPLRVDVMLPFVPLFFAFGLVLMIGCANVANLLLARGVARQREIGIRLAIGASRRRVIRQLLTESLLLALVSAALGFVIARVVLAGIVYAVTSTFPPELGNLRLVVPPADWRVALFLVAGAMGSTVFFALVPALQATRPGLTRAMRGEVVRDARPGRARSMLVALQVTGSAALLICAAVFLRSSLAAAQVDSGIRTDGVITVRVLDEDRRGALLDAAASEPIVESVAAAFPGFIGGLGGIPASAHGGTDRSAVTYQFVSPEYFRVLGIEIVRGRGFSPAERSPNAAVAIVSESVARQLWPGTDAVGQVLRIEPDLTPDERTTTPETTGALPADNPLLRPRTVDVVGVARDVAGFRFGGMRVGGAGVYVPIDAGTAATSLTMRVRGDAERARQALVDRLAGIDPNVADVSTLQTFARAEQYLLGIPFWLALVLGGLALLLTVSGLFSVLSYLVEQRSAEIGVRMALGATSGSIGALVLSQSVRPVGLGLLLGGGVTAALGAVLLATPAAALIGSSVRLFDPVAYLASLLLIVAACGCAALVPALGAARIDPVGALRQD